jgi:hypothetical protein
MGVKLWCLARFSRAEWPLFGPPRDQNLKLRPELGQFLIIAPQFFLSHTAGAYFRCEDRKHPCPCPCACGLFTSAK